MALQQGMRIEPDAVAVDQARDRAAFARADAGQSSSTPSSLDPLELRERRDVRMQRVELGKLVFAGMDQDRHAMAERRVGETGRRSFEKSPAGERQRPDQRVAERIMQHRRASAGRVIADGLLGLEDDDLGMGGERGRRGQSRDPAADDDDVAGAQLDEPASLSFTTLPPCVRRMALTISSSSGRTGRF